MNMETESDSDIEGRSPQRGASLVPIPILGSARQHAAPKASLPLRIRTGPRHGPRTMYTRHFLIPGHSIVPVEYLPHRTSRPPTTLEPLNQIDPRTPYNVPVMSLRPTVAPPSVLAPNGVIPETGLPYQSFRLRPAIARANRAMRLAKRRYSINLKRLNSLVAVGNGVQKLLLPLQAAAPFADAKTLVQINAQFHMNMETMRLILLQNERQVLSAETGMLRTLRAQIDASGVMRYFTRPDHSIMDSPGSPRNVIVRNVPSHYPALVRYPLGTIPHTNPNRRISDVRTNGTSHGSRVLNPHLVHTRDPRSAYRRILPAPRVSAEISEITPSAPSPQQERVDGGNGKGPNARSTPGSQN